MVDVLLITRVAGQDQEVDFCCCWCVVSILSWMAPRPSSALSVHSGWLVLRIGFVSVLCRCISYSGYRSRACDRMATLG